MHIEVEAAAAKHASTDEKPLQLLFWHLLSVRLCACTHLMKNWQNIQSVALRLWLRIAIVVVAPFILRHVKTDLSLPSTLQTFSGWCVKDRRIAFA